MALEPPKDANADGEWMSIGALSKATGIPSATLRSWERRYGFPKPRRLPSGHRRYALEDVGRLRLIKRALELGNRPSAVVGASRETLERLVEMDAARVASPAASRHVGRLMSHARWLDEAGFDRALQRAVDELGVRPFVHDCLVPFLRALGEAWADGALGVMHEHFASDRVEHLLAQRRSGHGGEAVFVCASLPGERHDLGLHIAALLLALEGARAVFLGADTPIEEIAGAAVQSNAHGVVIGSSVVADEALVRSQLTALRRALPAEVEVAVGGTRAAPEGVVLLPDFGALERWGEAVIAAAARR